MTAIKTLKKISVKELFGLKRTDDGAANIKKLMEEGHTKIFRIKGNVTGFTSKATNLGESFGLTGQFLAHNLVTNELFKSSKCYLPKDFTETIISNFKNRGDAATGVEFTAEISVVKDSSSASGYTYICEPIQTADTVAWEERAVKEFTSLPAPQVVKKIANGKK